MKAVFRRMVIENYLDVIFMPGNQSVALPHDTYGTPEYTVLAKTLECKYFHIGFKSKAGIPDFRQLSFHISVRMRRHF